MLIDIRPTNTRLSLAHSLDMSQRLKATFARLAHLVARIVVRVGDVPRSGPHARECIVEVHLPNGQISTIVERQRKLGALLRRATERAWRAANDVLKGQGECQEKSRLLLIYRDKNGQP